MENYNFESFDGEKLNCYEWLPNGKVKGIVQIIHGLQEHGLRYKNFAEFLIKHGYIVFASDQRLHGLTAGKNIGKTTIKDVFPIMVKDQMLIADMLLKKYNKPLIIFGHSYGSFETQSILQQYNKQVGIILCGSAYMKRADTLAAKVAAEAYVNIKNGESPVKEIEDFVINTFNKPFKNGTWVSANEANIQNYKNDKLCGVPLCANFYASMFRNVRKLYAPSALKKVDKNTPILIISGKDDPIGKMGESTTKLYEYYKTNGLNVELKLYDKMRHEILNEEHNYIVYNDILQFINNCTKKTH